MKMPARLVPFLHDNMAMLRLEGQIVSSKEKCNIKSFAELKAFIQQELKGINMEEAKNAR